MADVHSKTCVSCKQEKPTTEFWREAKCRDGLRPSCKVCSNAMWRATHKRVERHCKHCGNALPSDYKGQYCSAACVIWTRIDKSGGDGACWPWVGIKNKHGYGIFQFHGCTYFAHRLACGLPGRMDATGRCACHHCDNPICCNPAHLFIGTQADNVRDMVAKGRVNRNITWRDKIVASLRKRIAESRAQRPESQ